MRLRPVPGDTTRPITDRVKEALFNILGDDILEATLLDLFAGTGSVGIEALSRGASFVRFVDKSRQAVETIHHNLHHTHLHENAEVIQMDAFNLLKKPPDRNFDYVFIAPPQYKELWQKALQDLDTNPGWLSHEAWVVVQIDPLEYQKKSYTNFKEFEQRRYGSTLLIFYDLMD
jgi:16S rRNA (guanine966-N2)-methyltransferase